MSQKPIKVAFLDRDGVINNEINYLHKIEDFEYTDSCIKGLKNLQILGYEIIIITNQAGIARGYYSEEDYKKLTDWYLSDLLNKGVRVLDVFYCPHHPNGVVKIYSIECDCRKPKSGMILEALKKYTIDLDQSILVGDKITDINSAESAGIRNKFLVKTGHKLSKEDVKNNRVFDDLYSLSVSVS